MLCDRAESRSTSTGAHGASLLRDERDLGRGAGEERANHAPRSTPPCRARGEQEQR